MDRLSAPVSQPIRFGGSGFPQRIRRAVWLVALLAIGPLAVANDLANVDNITILPIAYPTQQTDEDRKERLEGLYGELDAYIYKALLRKLSLKGYVLDKPRKWTKPADWSVENLVDLPPEELAARLPQNAAYGAFLFIEQIDSSSKIVASSANAAVSVKIVQRTPARIAWQERAETRYSESLLRHLFFGPPMWLTPDKHVAVEKAFTELFDKLPDKF